MKFHLLIKKCTDDNLARTGAKVLSSRSGISVDDLCEKLLAGDMTLDLEALGEAGCRELQGQLEKCGLATVLDLGEGASSTTETASEQKEDTPSSGEESEVAKGQDEESSSREEEASVDSSNGEQAESPEEAEPAGKPIRAAIDVPEDEDEDYPSDPQNLVRCAPTRPDLFEVDNDRRLLYTILASLIIGLGFGFWFNGMELIDFSPDFFERLPPERTAKLVIDVPKIEEKAEKKKKKKKSREKTLEKKKQNRRPTGTGKGSGKGDPRARITRKGVLGIISGKVKGKTVVGSDILSKGGFAKDIDAILENVGGLKRSGSAGTGRKGLAGVGFGKGYGTGFGGGSGGIDDLLGGLLGGSEQISLKKKGKLKIELPKTVSGGPLAGGRTMESIMRVVQQHIAGLRYAYNKRLKVKPGLKGKITIRFAINAAGRIVSCKVVNSTMRDPTLEKEIVSQIRRWRFDPVEKKGLAEVEYPFAFFQ